jgi:PAS domain S-box-containing protein
VIGWIVIKEIGILSEAEERENFQQIAESISAAINPDRVNNLTGSKTDLENADYERLREQLHMVLGTLDSYQVASLYIMERRENEIIFLADSAPLGDPLHADPGVPYSDAPTDLYTVFNTAQPASFGPYTDQWGTYFSSFVPIYATDEPVVVGVLGIDVNATDWHSRISKRQYLPGVVTALVLVLYVVIINFFARRRVARQNLFESEQKFRGLTEAAQDGIVMMDDKNAIILWNNGAKRMFGWSASEAIGKNLHELIVVKPEQHMAHLENFFRTGNSPVIGKQLELRVKRKDKSTFNVELTISRTQLQGRWHAIGIMRDITERKKASDQLSQRTAQLERMNNAMVGREQKMIELKRTIQELTKGKGKVQ